MARHRRNHTLLRGPYVQIRHLCKELPGDLPNEIVLRHPETGAIGRYAITTFILPNTEKQASSDTSDHAVDTLAVSRRGIDI